MGYYSQAFECFLESMRLSEYSETYQFQIIKLGVEGWKVEAGSGGSGRKASKQIWIMG